jgi:AraC-like DNA-binding protein
MPSTAVKLILHSVDTIGLKTHEVLERSEIGKFPQDKDGLPLLSKSQFTAVYKTCVTALNHYAREQEGFVPATFEDCSLLGSCVVNCSSLEEVINQSIRFVRALNGRAGNLSLTVNDHEASLILESPHRENAAYALALDFFRICFFYKLFSWLIGDPLNAISVTISSRPQADASRLQGMLDGPVQVQNASNRITFRRELLQRPVVRTHNELMKVQQEVPIELMALPPATQLSSILEALFKKALTEKNHIPNVDRIAHLLGKSGPTLRRHLAQEKTSFQALLDKCRTEKAIELLIQSDLTIDDISFNLGFSAPSGFSRAFKDWTGVAPSAYRQTLRRA